MIKFCALSALICYKKNKMMKRLVAIILTGITIHVNAATRPDVIPSKLTEVKLGSWLVYGEV